MLPSKLYQLRCQAQNLTVDAQQQALVMQLDQLNQDLCKYVNAQPSFFSKLLGQHKQSAVKGMYLWGGVGRGKTMLMDIFFESLPFSAKRRLHFHHFINDIHIQLKQLEQQSNPLKIIADNTAREIKVLCLDEFHINDITDAMLMAGLLENLFAAGISLFTTSNRPPDDLYKDGLQRSRFIPAIELLKTHTHVINLDNNIDYRLRTLRKDGTYHYPLSEGIESHMQMAFTTLTNQDTLTKSYIEVNGRQIPTKGHAEGAIWFTFKALCESPRSQNDYIEIACEHHSVFLSGLPAMDDLNNDAARRFLNLLDVFYDHQVKLIISADTAIENIYTGKRLAFEFERASSRLIEMQSEEYLSKKHLC